MAISDGEALLRTEGLAKRFRSGANELTIFAGVDLDFRAGESVALVGESGAGKSTLLHLLGALDRPTEGAIYFQSQPLSSASDADLAAYRNRHVGFIWQSYHLLPEFTALENVAMRLMIAGLDRDKAEAEARVWLTEVGLAGRLTHQAGELSGGEQQRVGIARALAGRPRILLADEPTGNLDFRTADGVVELLLSLPRTHGVTTIIATHNLDFARRCGRILRLSAGRIFEDPQR